MAKTNFTQADLDRMGMVQNKDGTFQKAKSKPQPRELEKAKGDVLFYELSEKEIREKVLGVPQIDISNYDKTTASGFLERIEQPTYRVVKLTLFGEPMPKQSVRSFIRGNKIMHYQPKEMAERTANYIKQIKEQLPKDFVPFSEIVFVTKLHFVFAPLKAFHKVKGKMDAIRNGEVFYKTTKPDMPDNLKKLVNDSMSGLVFVDDALIVGEDNVRKYYGVGGCIIIEMKGR